MYQVEPWVYIAWFIILFVIIICVLYTLRPKNLRSDEDDDCELQPIPTMLLAVVLSLAIVLLMFAIHNYRYESIMCCTQGVSTVLV